MLLLNLAGGSAADPILRGLGLEAAFGASTMDIATLTDAWIDQNNSFPGTNSVKSSLLPAATVVISGNAGTYTNSNNRVGIGSTTGLVIGDLLYLSHPNITAGVYRILTIPVAGFVTLTADPFAAGGLDRTGVSFQVVWRYATDTNTAPIVSSSGGTLKTISNFVPPIRWRRVRILSIPLLYAMLSRRSRVCNSRRK